MSMAPNRIDSLLLHVRILRELDESTAPFSRSYAKGQTSEAPPSSNKLSLLLEKHWLIASYGSSVGDYLPSSCKKIKVNHKI